jgi:hypothetical protein
MPISVILDPPPQGIDPILRDWLHRTIDKLNSDGKLDSMAFSATPTFDATTSALFKMTLTANVTSSTILSGKEGQRITLMLTQDAVGGRTFAWPSNVTLQAGTIIDVDPNATTLVSLIYDNSVWNASDHPSTVMGTKTLDETDIADGRMLRYDSASGTLVYVDIAYKHTQAAPSATWTCIHNLNSKYVAVTVYDSTDKVIIPNTITATDQDTLTIGFATARTGVARIIA